MSYTAATDLTAVDDAVSLQLASTDTQANLYISGTYGTVTGVIEISQDNSNWAPVAAIDAGDGTYTTGTITLTDNEEVVFYVAVQNTGYVRFRLTAIASGTVVGEWNAGPFAAGSVSKVDTELPTAVSLNDAIATPTTPMVGAAEMGWDGAAWQRGRLANVQTDLNAAAASTTGNAAGWTPASGKKIRLMGGNVSLSVAGNLEFRDGAANGTVLYRTPMLAANGATSFLVNGGQGKLSGTANNALYMVASANGTVTGTVYGTEE